MDQDPFGPGYQLELWINDWREKKKAALLQKTDYEKKNHFKAMIKEDDTIATWWVLKLQKLVALMEESPPADEQEIEDILKMCVSMPSYLIFQSHPNQSQIVSALKRLAAFICCHK